MGSGEFMVESLPDELSPDEESSPEEPSLPEEQP
jgi:hypothetical protein